MKNVLILDLGGYYTKYGTSIMKVKRTNICYYTKSSFEIGPEAKNCTNIKPIKNGIVIDWECIKKLIEWIIYYELEIKDITKWSVVNIITNKSNNKKFNKLFLEEIGFNKCCQIEPSKLILLEKRVKTGLIIDIGHDITKLTPICEGYELNNNSIYSNFTGNAIDKVLNIKSFKKKKIDWNDDILNKLEYNEINLVEDINKVIRKLDINIRKKINNNIIISGYLFNNKIKEYLENKLDINIQFDRKNKNIKWYGAKKIVQMYSFNEWINREEYLKSI